MDKDDRWFERLFEDYYPGIVRFFVKKGCPLDDARDLAQEVFLRVFRGMEGFRGAASEKTWIFSITRRLWLNEIRYWKSRGGMGKTLSLDSTEPSIHSSCELPVDQRIEAEETRRKLWEAIKNLPPQQRLCVRLRLIHELKYREIAEIMGVSLDHVKTLLHDAKDNLRRSCGKSVPSFDEPDEGRKTP